MKEERAEPKNKEIQISEYKNILVKSHDLLVLLG